MINIVYDHALNAEVKNKIWTAYKGKEKKKVIKYKCRRHRGIGEQTARIKRSAEEDKPQTSQ